MCRQYSSYVTEYKDITTDSFWFSLSVCIPDLRILSRVGKQLLAMTVELEQSSHIYNTSKLLFKFYKKSNMLVP